MSPAPVDEHRDRVDEVLRYIQLCLALAFALLAVAAIAVSLTALFYILFSGSTVL